MELHHGFRAVSVNIITDYTFNHSYNLLDMPDLGKEFFVMVQQLGPTIWVFMQWPMLERFAMSLPLSVAPALSPPLKQLFGILEVRSKDSFNLNQRSTHQSDLSVAVRKSYQSRPKWKLG